MDTISKGIAYVEKIHSPYLGMYPDLGNLSNACKLYGLSVEEEIRRGNGYLLAMHLKETAPGRYRDMDFGMGSVDFARGVQVACDCKVRIFTAEFWHDGSEDWKGRLKRVNAFLRKRLDAAYFGSN